MTYRQKFGTLVRGSNAPTPGTNSQPLDDPHGDRLHIYRSRPGSNPPPPVVGNIPAGGNVPAG